MTREELMNVVTECRAELEMAQNDLIKWDQAIENNVYNSVEAAGILEDVLLDRAMADCEGSYNCGEEFYTQDFLVDGVAYRAVLECEYNRHDKTYYYVDGHKFKIVKMKETV